MKIPALEHEFPGATLDQFNLIAVEEARRVWQLRQSGLIRELYFRADRNEAVLVLECSSAAGAQEVLAALPFVQAGLIMFEVIPLKGYPGFACSQTWKCRPDITHQSLTN